MIIKRLKRAQRRVKSLPNLLLSMAFLFFLSSTLVAREKAAEKAPPPKGNFALPASQQPGAFISFGENVINKDQKQLYLFLDDYAGKHKHSTDIISNFVYGITDNLSLFFSIPFAASYQQNETRSSGLEDILLQLEYAFYNNTTVDFTDQATLVGYVALPTGSKIKQPTTGNGALSYFLGATFNRTFVDWLFFTSQGAVFSTSDNNTRFGNKFLYQFGFGRNIMTINSKWIFALIMEADGTYATKDIIQAITNPNSGGNILYVTPSLWISSQNLIIQLGAGWPITQNLFGNQNQQTYLLASNIGITF